jgi:hypothetical protein
MTFEPDRNQIEIFVDAIFKHAGNEGYVSFRSFLADSKVLKPIQKAELKTATCSFLVDVAEDQARRAANNPEPAVFCPPLAVFNGASGWQAREQDLLKGLTISVECDEHPDEARRTLEEILGPATAIVRSGGQWVDPEDGSVHDKLHLHWRLNAPAMVGALDKLKRARRLATTIVGGDASNIPAVHCLRWPGSWHRKAAPRLCELVSVRPEVEIDLDEALQALEEAAPPEPAKPNGRGSGEQTSNPEDWEVLAGNLIAGRDLHLSIARLAAKYVRSGMSNGAAVNLLRGLMNLSAARLQRPEEWQSRYDDIPRAVDTAEAKCAKANARPAAQATPLNDVVKVFGKWIVLKDETPLYAMLGTVAANLLDGDPVWLGLIAPPSSAKTELLNSLSQLPFVFVSECLSPGALLSGTPRRQKTKAATGGLLQQLGKFGIIAFKDFGSVLDMRSEARGEMLSALRRVFDGEYVRQIGSDGGQTLTWRGKVGLIFAATQKYDLYHGIIGTLGDRFLLIRLDAADEQFDKCFDHVGKATHTMRDELATAVAGLFAGLPNPLPEPGPLTADEKSELKRTVVLATRLRAGVERDRIKREIEAVYDPEGPARLALSLERLFSGLLVTGIKREHAMEIVHQVAMDSTPRFRLKVLGALTEDWQTTREIATAVKLPTTTTYHALEELTAHSLAVRQGGSEGVPNRWRRNP